MFEEILPDEWSNIFEGILTVDWCKVEADLARISAAWEQFGEATRAALLIVGEFDVKEARSSRLAA